MADSLFLRCYRSRLFCILILSIGLFLAGGALLLWLAWQAPQPPPIPAAPGPETPDLPASIHERDGAHYFTAPAVHKLQDVLLQHVGDDGLVDYASIQSQPDKLHAYYYSLAYLDPVACERWSAERQLAFWINAYNALTLLIVSQEYPAGTSLYGFVQNLLGHEIPVNSIRQLPFVWEQTRFQIMGRHYTLNDIEHQVLRQKFNDARIHMAITCASAGCPPLRNEPYSEHQLTRQLELQTRAFLLEKAETRILINHDEQRISLSPILQWFAEDFISGNKAPAQSYRSAGSEAERAVLLFISRYLPVEQGNWLRTGDYTITYRDYDWSLNEKR